MPGFVLDGIRTSICYFDLRKKKQEKKKADPKPKPVADKKSAGDGQLSLLDLGVAKAG